MSRCVLHVTGDYPDHFLPNKTPVIRCLVDELSAHCRNIVVSINRVSRPDQESVFRDGDVFAVRYFSPPLGVLQSFFLDRLARRIVSLLDCAGIRPDVGIGHKFTIESYLVWQVARYFKIPYVAAFMGNSDRKIFRLKPHYHKRYRQIIQGASAVLFPTPWCRDYFAKRLLINTTFHSGVNVEIIPYISSEYVRPRRSSPVDARRFLIVCRLDVWRIKNLPRLIQAITILRRESPDWKLDIVGTGSENSKAAIRELIEKSGSSEGVRMLGGKQREEIDQILPDYSAMVMPSYPESFGLVYLEALAQGVPIMTARNSGFDGFFPDAFPGVVVRHDRVSEIVKGLRRLAAEGDAYRTVIANAEDLLGEFNREVIVNRYRNVLEV